jgi:hypothetical protein
MINISGIQAIIFHRDEAKETKMIELSISRIKQE